MNRLFVWLQYLLPKHSLSRLVRALAESRVKWWKGLLIGGFVRLYRVDLNEAQSSDPRDYDCFRSFFARALKAGARPISSRTEDLCWPADGTLIQHGSITHGQVVQAKGLEYSLKELLRDEALAEHYEGGWFATIYLAPYNYHRVHAPLGGRVKQMRHIPGSLFSVNAATVRHLPGLFARNERTLCQFAADRADVGDFHVILVGALLVSGIEIVSSEAQHCTRGDEIGRFNYGSTVILLFRKDTIVPLPNLATGAAVKMGETFATLATT